PFPCGGLPGLPFLPSSAAGPGPAGPARRQAKRSGWRQVTGGAPPYDAREDIRGGAMNRWIITAALVAFGAAAGAQSGRTLEELKAETQARADRNAYPLIGFKPEDVREALSRIRSLDRDEWAASWSEI